MSEFDQADQVEPEESPDEEEYAGEDPGATSTETGTFYDERGEAELTPQDLQHLGEDDE